MRNNPPEEYTLATNIKRFGIESILGRRVFSCGEIYRTNYIDNLQYVFDNIKDLTTIAKNSPALFRMYVEARKLAEE